MLCSCRISVWDQICRLADDLKGFRFTCKIHAWFLLATDSLPYTHLIQLIIWFNLIFLTVSVVQQNVITVRWCTYTCLGLLLEYNSLSLDLAFFSVFVMANIGRVLCINNLERTFTGGWLLQAILCRLCIRCRLLSTFLTWCIQRSIMISLRGWLLIWQYEHIRSWSLGANLVFLVWSTLCSSSSGFFLKFLNLKFGSFFLSTWLNRFVKSRFNLWIRSLIFLRLAFLCFLSLLLCTFLFVFESFKSLKFLSSLFHCLSFNCFLRLLFFQFLLNSFQLIFIANLYQSSTSHKIMRPNKLFGISLQESIIFFPFNFELSLDILEFLFCLFLA